MKTNSRIAFITDLHLPAKSEKARGVDTYLHLDWALDDLVTQNINHIIIGGDISFKEPLQQANEYLLEKLIGLNIDFSVIPGNHDHAPDLITTFDIDSIHGNELYYVKYISEYPCIFLDSSQKWIGSQQKNWLREALIQYVDVKLIFIHHPIISANVPYMDLNHKLENSHEIFEILSSMENEYYIISGHYHIDKNIHYKNVIQYITPSLYVQIDDQCVNFRADHYVPGYRIIEIGSDYIESKIRYKFL